MARKDKRRCGQLPALPILSGTVARIRSAGRLQDTLVIAPRFAASGGNMGNGLGACHDQLAFNEADWDCEVQRPNSWRSGGAESGSGGLTSYDFMDHLLMLVSNKAVFPNLRAIVLAGHSAGAQFVIRYQMSNRIHERLGTPVSYIVANSSGYPYLDERRPTVTAIPRDIAASAPGYSPAPSNNPLPEFSLFADATNCGTFDDWPYGLKKRVGYSSGVGEVQMKTQIVSRPLIFLLGEYDILPLSGFDGSCPAMAQGPTRLARGLIFKKYLNEQYQAQHSAMVVPLCGHNPRCMFTANSVLPMLFPR